VERQITMRTRLIALALLLGPLLASAALAQAVPMAPGVLVDAGAKRAFVADAAGFAQALSLDDGSTAWISRETAFPLLQRGDSVIALGRIDSKGVGIVLVLDAADGTIRDRIAFDVPEHVAASVMPTPKATFTVQAQDNAQGVRVFWREVAYPLRGALIPGEEGPRITEGAFELVLDVQRNFAMPLRGDVSAPLLPPPDLAADQRLPGLGERQFRALGDVAAMSSAPVADERLGAVWQWTVQARGGDGTFAGPRLPYAYLPFALIGEQLLYRTEPAGWVEASGAVVQHGAQLVAWDLAGGRRQWQVDVLDLVYRGPMPP
jgi:hypothetical protein